MGQIKCHVTKHHWIHCKKYMFGCCLVALLEHVWRLTAQSVGRSVSHFLFFRSPPPFQRKELMHPLWASSERIHTKMPSTQTQGCFTRTNITLLYGPNTLNAIYEVLLVGSDVQILNNRVQRRDGRGFHHCCLFQAAYAGLWWKRNDILESFIFRKLYRKVTTQPWRLSWIKVTCKANIKQDFTSNLKLWAAHPPELAVDRVHFFDQGVQNCVTDPL